MPRSLLKRPNMRALETEFQDGFSAYYHELLKSGGRLSKSLSESVTDDDLRGALGDVGVKSGVRLASVLGLGKRRGAEIWKNPHTELNSRNLLALQSWAWENLHTCEDILKAKADEPIDPKLADKSRLIPPGGWGKKAAPEIDELRQSYETLVELIFHNEWFSSHAAVVRSEYLKRCAAEYTVLLDQVRLSSLLTTASLLNAGREARTTADGNLSLYAVIRPLGHDGRATILDLADALAEARLDESRDRLSEESELSKEHEIIVLHDSLRDTDHGREATYLDLLRVIANPAGPMNWVLNNAIEVSHDRWGSMLTDEPPTRYPLDAFAEYSGFGD